MYTNIDRITNKIFRGAAEITSALSRINLYCCT